MNTAGDETMKKGYMQMKMAELDNQLKKMKDKGITDSFIAIYKDGERVLSK